VGNSPQLTLFVAGSVALICRAGPTGRDSAVSRHNSALLLARKSLFSREYAYGHLVSSVSTGHTGIVRKNADPFPIRPIPGVAELAFDHADRP
jgi:hypothetical protein